MAKVAKNLKKFRVAKNLTQNELAEKLFVTRQTVSGWENDRTQPDVEMLCKISEVLEVSVEDLIYGEKRYATDEENLRSRKKILTIVFSVMASVLTGVGLIFIFVTWWSEMPDALKGILAFIPMLTGQGAAVYTYLKRRESVAWREGASILWCAGVTATVALVNTVFEIEAGFVNCLIVDLLMYLLVIYFMDVASPLIVYYGGIITFNYYMAEIGYGIVPVIISFVFFAAGLGYVIKNIRRKEDPRHLYTVWISVIAGAFILIFNVPVFETELNIALCALTAYFISIYLGDKYNNWSMPFAPLGILGLGTTSVSAVYLCDSDIISGKPPVYMTVVLSVFVVCMIAAGLVSGFRILKNNRLKLVCIILSIINVILQITGFAIYGNKNGLIYALVVITSLSVVVCQLIDGVISGKFFLLNSGLICTSVIVAYLIYKLIDVDFLATGVMLLAFGLVLFLVNFLLARKMKIPEEEGAENEKQ